MGMISRRFIIGGCLTAAIISISLLAWQRQRLYETFLGITGDKIVCAELHSRSEVEQAFKKNEAVNEKIIQQSHGHAYLGIDTLHGCGKNRVGLLLHYDGEIDKPKLKSILDASPLDKYTLRFIPS